MLFVLTMVYPLFLHNTWYQRILIWIVLAMGFFYSCPPVRFKRIPPLATVYLVINFNIPIVIGYQMATGLSDFPPYLLSTTALFLANFPLKDYGDREGDLKVGMGNWVGLLGSAPNLLILSSILSISGAVTCFFLLPDLGSIRWIFVLLPLVPAANILFHKVMGLNMDRMFTHGVRMLILLCIIVVALS